MQWAFLSFTKNRNAKMSLVTKCFRNYSSGPNRTNQTVYYGLGRPQGNETTGLAKVKATVPNCAPEDV